MILILVVSDIHYDKTFYKGVDQSKAWEWLLSIVDYHKPKYLLSLGDWGYGASQRDFIELVSRVRVYTIYGNHDDLDMLKSIRNIDDTPILLKDAEIKNIDGLIVAGINGVTATKRTEKKKVPRKKPDEFLGIARKIASSGFSIDILLIHEAPYLPDLFPQIVKREGILKALESIKIVKPKLVFHGHMHSGCFKTKMIGEETRYIYIDSSQNERCYIVINNRESNIDVEVWRDLNREAEICSIGRDLP